MQGLYWALCGAGILFTVAVLTGWWRYALRPLCIRPSKMTVRRLQLQITDPADIDRVDSVLASFAGGFNKMIAAPSESAWQAFCQSQTPILRPFAEEGAAMGYTVRRLFRYDAADFESRIVKPRPEFRYLYYVGLGFWSGMRNHSANRVAQLVKGLDPLHSYLCFDGYGFKRAFFDYPRNRDALTTLNTFEGYARHAAYQGVGRALHFLFMGRPDLVIERVVALGPHAMDAAAGVGLAAAFVNPDRLLPEFELGLQMPKKWQPHFHLGLCFGLKARAINDLDAFDQNLALLPPAAQDAIRAAIRECDRIELLIRADGQPDGYRRWRERVTEWMTINIEFPMQRQMPTEATRQQGNDETRAEGSYLSTTASPLTKGGTRGVELGRSLPSKKTM